jgi:DNA-binding transcriptional LysR family regulator
LGSISAAAHRVHLTQPAVNQAVAGVERYFGAALFTRSSAGMRLTRAGEICAERIERALAQLREGVADLKRSAGGDAGDAEHVARLMRTPQLQGHVAANGGREPF